MRRRTRRNPDRYDGKDARLQLTSMIDVVFLLLLFFLCSPFKSPEGELDACMPKDKGPEDTPVVLDEIPPLQVSLKHVRGGAPRVLFGVMPIPSNRDGRSGSSEPDFEWLAAKLVGMGSGAGGDVKVKIDSDPLVQYGYVVKTLNACTKAGVTDIRFGYPRRVSSS